MTDPILTVIITNYNHAQYLPKAIDSLLTQSFSSFEILIIDDASSDNSLEIINQYMEKHENIRLIAHKKNKGVCFSLSEGLDKAFGTYVHTMGADDFRLPNFLNKTMQYLLANPDIGIACSDFGFIKGASSEGTIQTDRLYEEIDEPTIFTSERVVTIFQTSHFWIPGHTAIFKKSLGILYGKYEPNLQFLCDWFLLHHIALQNGVIYIPETLSIWWIHDSSYSSSLLENNNKKKMVYQTVLKLIFDSNHKLVRKKFIQSTLLHLIIKSLIRDIWFFPRYWSSIFYLAKKSLYWRTKLLREKLS